jgi:hypothetical protein
MASGEGGLGGIAKRWLKAKATELTKTDDAAERRAGIESNRAEAVMKDKLASELVMTAFPAVRRMEERREADAAAREERYRADVRAKPTAPVELVLTGDVTGSWSGQLPLDIARVQRDTYTDGGEVADLAAEDLVLEITVLPEDAPLVDGRPFLGLRMVVPDFRGSGTYDFPTIARRREAAGDELDLTDTTINVGSDDDPYYWDPDSPGTIVVDSDGGSVRVRMAMVSANSAVHLSAVITTAIPR